MPRLANPIAETVTLAEATDQWIRSLRSANKSPRTCQTYAYATGKLAEQLGPDRAVGAVSRRDHEDLLASLSDRGWKPSSVSTVYRSLRTFWAFAVAHDGLPVTRDPMNGMAAPVVPETVVRFPTDDEVRAVLATCQTASRHNFLGHRDEALIRIFATTGARLSEIALLRLQDVDLGLMPVIEVVGKGRRERDLALDDATLRAVRRYLERERPRHPAAASTDRVWLARAGLMTPNGIAQMVAERGIEAGLPYRLHPHMFRHRAIAVMLGAGFSEGDTMAISGHRSRSMMDRYGQYTRSARALDAFRKASATGALPKL